MDRKTAAEDNAHRGDTPVPDSQEKGLNSRALQAKYGPTLLGLAVISWKNFGCHFYSAGVPGPRESWKGIPNYLE